jgi:hypothetical protein
LVAKALLTAKNEMKIIERKSIMKLNGLLLVWLLAFCAGCGDFKMEIGGGAKPEVAPKVDEAKVEEEARRTRRIADDFFDNGARLGWTVAILGGGTNDLFHLIALEKKNDMAAIDAWLKARQEAKKALPKPPLESNAPPAEVKAEAKPEAPGVDPKK